MSTFEPTDAGESPHPARCRFGLRFSLRTLLIGMTVVCLVSGYWFDRAIRQRTAVRRFYELTAARTQPGDEELVTMSYRYRGKNQYYKPIVPKWLHPWRDLIGEEAFGEVTGVQLIDTAATDTDLRFLRDVPTVERVLLSRTKVTDRGIGYLLACPKLRYLAFDGLPITDRGIAKLTQFTELDCLSLSGTKVTDAGLEHLARLPKLKELWLRDTAITDAGYRRLQAALPECKIQADVSASLQQQQLQMFSSPARWQGYAGKGCEKNLRNLRKTASTFRRLVCLYSSHLGDGFDLWHFVGLRKRHWSLLSQVTTLNKGEVFDRRLEAYATWMTGRRDAPPHGSGPASRTYHSPLTHAHHYPA